MHALVRVAVDDDAVDSNADDEADDDAGEPGDADLGAANDADVPHPLPALTPPPLLLRLSAAEEEVHAGGEEDSPFLSMWWSSCPPVTPNEQSGLPVPPGPASCNHCSIVIFSSASSIEVPFSSTGEMFHFPVLMPVSSASFLSMVKTTIRRKARYSLS
jgi:hypothetical protein